MGRTPWAMYLWPGLPQLWVRGWWSGLVLAAGFGVLFDLLVLATAVWVELLSPMALRLGWLGLGSLWCASAALSVAYRGSGGAGGIATCEALFREAISEYLQGSWFETEAKLSRLLRQDPRDVEGRLLLATLLRHTERFTEAVDHLDRLERLRGAERWREEIAAERHAIAEARAAPEPADEGPMIMKPIQQASRQAA